MRLLSALTLLVAVAWLYLTWLPMYRWLERTLVFGELNIITGVMNDGRQDDGDDLREFSKLLIPGSPKPAAAEAASSAAATDEKSGEPAAEEAKTAQVHIAQNVLRGASIGWLGMMTLVGLWLTAGGVAGLTSSASGRRAGAVLLPIVFAAGGVTVWYIWREYQWYQSLLPRWVMPAVLGLAAIIAALIGAMLNRHSPWLQRAGGYLVIVSALMSVAAIWAAVRWGQMPADQVNTTLYGKVFGVQSAYGWLLLIGTIGLRPR